MADRRRDKGEGSIYFRESDKRWVAKIRPDNSSKPKVFYGKTELEVKKKLREFKKEIAKISGFYTIRIMQRLIHLSGLFHSTLMPYRR